MATRFGYYENTILKQYGSSMSSNSRSNPHRKCRKNNFSQFNDDDDFQEEPKRTSKSDSTKKKTSVKRKPVDKDKLEQTALQKPIRQKSTNSSTIAYYQYRESTGQRISRQLEKVFKNPVITNAKFLKVYKSAAPFDRRVTALAWHPKYQVVLAVGSKGGDIILWNYNQPSPERVVEGQGPGGSIQAMKFDQFEDNKLYTASIDGTFCAKDLQGNNSFVYLNTNDFNRWFTSLDVCFSSGLIVSGDCKGVVHLLTKSGNKVGNYKLHKQKVTHIEFSMLQPWLVVTSSVDNTVKLWDIRHLKDASSNLAVLPHKRAVNSAYFSPSHGTRILTTDQHSEINVFCGPLWNLETSIAHPHRQFQHLTPIKAQWHPLEDIVVVGRYPDPKFPGYTEQEARSIDFFDASDGQLMWQLEQSGVTGIISLNQFNSNGSALASGMASQILIWRPKYPENVKGSSASDENDEKPFRPASRTRRSLPDDDADLKKSKKVKLASNSKK